MANDVAVGLAVLVAAKREDARRAEEDRLRAEEAARRRNEAKRLAYIEERRLKVLEAGLGRVEQRDRLRRLAKQLPEDIEGAHPPRASEFVTWLHGLLAKAGHRERAAGQEAIFKG